MFILLDYTTIEGRRVQQVHMQSANLETPRGSKVHKIVKLDDAQVDEYIRTGKVSNI